MILKAANKYIDMSSVRHLLAAGEKNADFLTFQVSKNYNGIDLSGCAFIMQAVNKNKNFIEQTLKKEIQDDFILLTWTVDEYFTAVSGVLKLEIKGFEGDNLIIKYDLSDIFVRESAVGEGLPEIPDITVIQGEKGDPGKDGLSAYEIWLSIGNSGTSDDFLTSLKGDKGDTGQQGIQGEDGKDGINGINGKDGKNGKSAYEIWLDSGNSGTESDFLNSLKGEICSTDVDDKFSEISENPIQNKVIANEIAALWNQLSNLNDLISSIPSTGGNIRITTLFDNSNHSEYAGNWNFKCSHWDSRIFSFDETATKNSDFCNEKNNYCMKFSNSFGWGADVTAVCSEPIQINGRSVLIVNYSCTSDGNGITAELIKTSDFEAEKIAEFEIIPAFYVTNTFISAVFRLTSSPENSSYCLKLGVNTTNPTFIIKNISVINQ